MRAKEFWQLHHDFDKIAEPDWLHRLFELVHVLIDLFESIGEVVNKA